MRKQKGFSLIELLIVVAIILIIAAIAIPNLLRAKISANESSAVGSVRNIVTQEIAYSSTYQDTGYAPAIVDLGPVAGQPSCLPTDVPAWNQACLIDGVLALGVKSGYGFEANILALGPGAGNQTCPVAGPAVANACLIDAVLSGAATGTAVKSGYGFQATGANPTAAGVNQSFTAAAVPVTFNQSGTRDFCAIEDGVARGNLPAAANTGGFDGAGALAGGGAAVCTAAPFTAL